MPPPQTPSGTQAFSPSAHYLSCPNPLFPPPSSPCVPVHPMASPPPFLLALALRLWEESEDMKRGCYSHPKSRRGNSKTQIPITRRLIHPPDFSLSPRYPGSGSISPGAPGASSSNRIFLCSSRSPSDGAGLGESTWWTEESRQAREFLGTLLPRSLQTFYSISSERRAHAHTSVSIFSPTLLFFSGFSSWFSVSSFSSGVLTPSPFSLGAGVAVGEGTVLGFGHSLSVL